MNLQGISYSDQLIGRNALPHQKRHCCTCLNRQREQPPIWEQDYLLLRKIVKAAAISIACTGALYLLNTLCKAAYDDGFDLGKRIGWQQGQNHTKQRALEQITTCLSFKTTESMMNCVKNQISWIVS